MNPLSQLPGKMDELLDSFMTHPIFGNTTFGFTNYIFWMCVALALLLIVIFVFVRKQKKSLVPQGIFVNSVEYLVEFMIPGRDTSRSLRLSFFLSLQTTLSALSRVAIPVPVPSE